MNNDVPYFTTYYTTRLRRNKPDAGIFHLACRNLGIAATDAVFVVDNPVADIEGANAVGMFSVILTRCSKYSKNRISTLKRLFLVPIMRLERSTFKERT